MGDYIRTYELTQHTPLIHFQSDQIGATLRATEVKPKLDKWLKRKAKEIPEDWYTRGESGALDYKLRFVCDSFDRVRLGTKTPYDIYYGNMGGKETFGVVAQKVTMTVVCFHPGLLCLIDGQLRDFFLATNFGRMQSKGFGSFTVNGKPYTEKDIAAVLCETYGAKKCYTFKKGNRPFKQIKTLYGMMKSGVNFQGYRRSLLFMYMHEEYGIGNEKAHLKETGVAPKFGTHVPNFIRTGQKYRYVRALMGIGDHIEFRDRQTRDVRKIAITSEKIKRLASTVLFKVIDGSVYYVGKRINEIILGQEFRFSGTGRPLSVSVPSKDDGIDVHFMDGFLAYCFRVFNAPTDGGQPLNKFEDAENLSVREVGR